VAGGHRRLEERVLRGSSGMTRLYYSRVVHDCDR